MEGCAKRVGRSGIAADRQTKLALPGRPATAPNFTAAWELDLWGRVRREVEAADASVEVAENDRQGVLLSLLAETARDYIQLRAVQSTLAVIRENLDVSRHSLRLSQMRLNDGVATNLDVAQAKAQVASIEARLPTLEDRQAQLINALSLLLAEPPRSLQNELLQPAPMPQTAQRFAMGLPSELAERRPDIRQAQAQLHASTASIGVAKANFYPSIRLSGSAGFQSLQLSDFGNWSSRRFAIGPQLSLPIFEGGRLTGIELAYDQALRFLPAPFDGLGVTFNFTYADSELNTGLPLLISELTLSTALRTAATSSVAALSLVTKPLAPACSARMAYCSSLCIVSTSTATEGNSLLMRRVSSSPLMPGMDRSTMARS